MMYEAREYRTVARVALASALVGWACLLLVEYVRSRAILPMGAGCAVMIPPMTSSHYHSLPSVESIGMWGLMLVAMMAPILAAPICDIRLQSFSNGQTRPVALFLAGYLISWFATGYVVLLLKALSEGVHVRSGLFLLFSLLLMLVWQCSPAKQYCMNRCHRGETIPVFGFLADRGAVTYGLRYGLWCIGTCLPLMIVPLFVSSLHLVVMAGTSAFILGERYEPARAPAWQWRGVESSARIVAGQARLYWRPAATRAFASNSDLLSNYFRRSNG